MTNNSTGLLKEKVIVISGGTKGVGRDLAFACAKEGAYVVIGGRDRESAEIIIDKIRDSTLKDALFVFTDLHQPEYCEKLFEGAVSRFGRVDGFVNYAGVTPVASLLDCTIEEFDEVMDVNFRAAFFCTKYAVHSMMKSGGGSIILVNSCHAWRGQKDRVAYACSKGALLTLSEHVAYHYGKNRIRCNTITMGWSATEGEIALREKQSISLEELHNMASQMIPMGRMQVSEDYIPGIIYLLSDYSAMATGGNLRISGGLFL